MPTAAKERSVALEPNCFPMEASRPGIWLFLKKTDMQVENGGGWRGWDGRRGKRKRWHRRKSPASRGRVTGTDFCPPQNSGPRNRTQVGPIGKHVRDQRWGALTWIG